MYALGGNPGAGADSAAGLMAVLGNCPATGNFLAATPYILINEVSTVAAAYAFAGFATDATHVGSSGTALALTGIANAFANAGNLVTLSTGAALAATPAGNGTVPQAEINTLGNVLASCVNSTGAGSGGCSTLFGDALSGGSTGTAATDTASAAINIAHNPGANVAGLYGLASGTPPFGPGLCAAPNDWTVEIAFAGGGLTGSGYLAVDSSGNVWVSDARDNSVIKFSSLGAVLSGTSGYTGGGLSLPRQVAIDPSDNAWIIGTTMQTIVEISKTGTFLSGQYGYSGYTSDGISPVAGADGIAIDGSGNVWVPTTDSYAGIAEFANSGSFIGWIQGNTWGMRQPRGPAVTSTGNVWIADSGINSIGIFSSAAFGGSGVNPAIQPGGGLNGPVAVAFDASGNGWLPNSAGNSVTKVSSSYAALSPSGGFTGGGLVYPYCLAVDGAGDVWVGGFTSENLVEFSNLGSVLSGANGYRTGDQNEFDSIVVDSSGNIWTPNNNSVDEIIGAATPVVTPLSVGVKNNTLGTRP